MGSTMIPWLLCFFLNSGVSRRTINSWAFVWLPPHPFAGTTLAPGLVALTNIHLTDSVRILWQMFTLISLFTLTPHITVSFWTNLLDKCCFHLNCNNQLIHWMENLFTYVMSTNFSPNSFRHITWTTGYSKRWTVWLINTLKVMQHNFLTLFMRQLTFIIFPLVNNTWHSITVVKSCNSDLIFECNH